MNKKIGALLLLICGMTFGSGEAAAPAVEAEQIVEVRIAMSGRTIGTFSIPGRLTEEQKKAYIEDWIKSEGPVDYRNKLVKFLPTENIGANHDLYRVVFSDSELVRDLIEDGSIRFNTDGGCACALYLPNAGMLGLPRLLLSKNEGETDEAAIARYSQGTLSELAEFVQYPILLSHQGYSNTIGPIARIHSAKGLMLLWELFDKDDVRISTLSELIGANPRDLEQLY